MIRLARFSVLVLALLSGLGFQEGASVVDRIIDEGRKRSEVMPLLDHLVNQIGPRLTSSDRLTRAASWARHQFESFGLKNCRLEEWGTFPVGFNRGPWSGRMIEPEGEDLTFATMSWTPGTKGPVEGLAVMGPSTEAELEAVEPNLAGAWVLSPGVSTSAELNEKILAAYDKAGIAGLIRRGGADLIITSGNNRISWEKLPKRVNIVLIRNQFEKIKAHIADGKHVKLRFDIRNEFVPGPIPLFNVLAEIPGTEKPEEMVIVGGHLDSWDGATGTTDNGTGTATTLEAARLLMKAGARPKRTIRFMLWSGEEQGLLGSRAYIKAHPEENARISAVLVHDGGTNYVSGIQATKAMMPIFEKAFEPLMGLNPDMPFKIREVAGLPMGIGSDHDSYLMAGVPGFFWSQAGKANYTHTHHTQYDTFDAAIPEYQQHTSMVVAIGAYAVANLDAMLPREGLTASRAPGRKLGDLGVGLQDDGVTLKDVAEGKPAQKAGFKDGDRILKIGAKDVTDYNSLREALRDAPQKTKWRVKRGDKELEIEFTFTAAAPAAPEGRRMLGVNVEEDGATLSEVVEGSSAEKAGLKVGDLILKIGTKAVKDYESLVEAIQTAPKETKVLLRRGGKEIEVPVTFDR